MNNAREFVGALTQARVQMMAAQVVLEEDVNEETDDERRYAKQLDVQKLKRSILVVGDVREQYSRPEQTKDKNLS